MKKKADIIPTEDEDPLKVVKAKEVLDGGGIEKTIDLEAADAIINSPETETPGRADMGC
tara:strand:- start:625 stop:801 length:177 start_codon:yes stop_codon:yes gene_type:complete